MPISSAAWADYPWKNELALQADRALQHAREICDDEFTGEHSPQDMLERAIVLAAFSVRRMVEKKLVTDRWAAETCDVRSFPARTVGFHPPLNGQTGGHAFRNYSFEAPEHLRLRPVDLANELIHSSQLMVVEGEEFAEDGFLIASDRHLKKRLLHLSFDEFQRFVRSALDDRVVFSSDQWNPETGQVTSVRE